MSAIVWVVPADETQPVSVESWDKVSLKPLQSAVGGYIEVSGQETTAGDLSFYFNEEGKLEGLAPNRRGTELWEAACRSAGTMHLPGDYLAGTVVIAGGVDDEGESLGLTEQAIAFLATYLDVRV